MERVSAPTNGGLGRSALTQLHNDVDVHRPIPDEDLHYYVLRSTPHQQDLSLQTPQQNQMLGDGNRSTAHVARCMAGPQHGYGAARQQLRQPPMLVGQNCQMPQVAGTLSVPSSILLDNYSSISGRLLHRTPPENGHRRGMRDPMMSPDSHSMSMVSRAPMGHMGHMVEDSHDHMERTHKKREKNRIAQQRFRMRQKQLVSDLQANLKTKTMEIQDLKKQTGNFAQENKVLREVLIKMGIDADNVIEKSRQENIESVEPSSDNCVQEQNTTSMEDEKMSDQDNLVLLDVDGHFEGST